MMSLLGSSGSKVAPVSLDPNTVSMEEVEKLGANTLPVGSVVKILTTSISPAYSSPWRVNGQKASTASGFCIDGKIILTNAHCVENVTVLQVQTQDKSKKWKGKVKSVAYDLDLAIIEVDDDMFWDTVAIASLAAPEQMPVLYSEVNVIGFPLGGSTVCVTKGVISRVDAHLYVYPASLGINVLNSPGDIIIIQVDSAINPGNSGGPAVNQNGEVVGVASSVRKKAQNVGYVIPIAIVHLFLNEVASTGKWSGVSELGLRWRQIESDSYRAFLGMKDTETGILVDRVAPMGRLQNIIRSGDIITHVDGLQCSNEGKLPLQLGGQKIFVNIEAIVTKKAKEAVTTFVVLRHNRSPDGTIQLDRLELNVSLAPIPTLAPRFHGVDVKPEYVIIAGLVFSRESVPLKISDLTAYNFKKNEEQEVITLVQVLTHHVNLGCTVSSSTLRYLNGKRVKTLKQLASIAWSLDRGDSFQQYLEFDDDEDDADIDEDTESRLLQMQAEQPKEGDGNGGEIDIGCLTANEAKGTSFVFTADMHSDRFLCLEFGRSHRKRTRYHQLPDVAIEISKIPSANAEILRSHAIASLTSKSLLPL